MVKQLNDTPQTRFDPIYAGSWEERISNNDSTMVFGPQLANPYNVDVMRQALATIREDNPDFFFPAINTSHYYVRFQPDSYEQMCDLFARDTSIIYFDFPLDREVVSGNSYHDPSIVDTLPTYQYASIRTTKWANLINGFDIDYEILDELFIPDDAGLTIIGYTPRPGVGNITPINPGDSTIWGHPIFPGSVADPNSSGTSVTWNAVNDLEDMAYQITGNSDEEETDTNGSIASPASNTVEPMSSSSNGRWTPSGRIRVYDDVKGGMIPLEGVKVIAYRGCKTKQGFTDSIGNFTCDGSFKYKANYKIKWERGYWDIRDGLTGQAYYNGPKSNGEWNLDLANNKHYKSLGYATIHRALHRMFYGDIGGLDRLQMEKKIKVCYIHDDKNPSNGRYGLALTSDNGQSAPKIRIYGYVMVDQILDIVSTQKMFYAVCHEVGHVIHYAKNRPKYNIADTHLRNAWARLVEYVVGKIEYESLNLWAGEGCLNETEVLVDDNGVSKTWIIPQDYYNFQADIDPQNTYAPILIDVVDDYNQKEYYDCKLGIDNSGYIDDIISLPESFVAPYVYSSLTVEEVGQKIHAQITITTDASKLKSLFDQYGYNITED